MRRFAPVLQERTKCAESDHDVGRTMNGCYHQHDHDDDRGTLRPHDLAASTQELLERVRPRRTDAAYWVETGTLVREYMMLQAGADYSDTLRQGFVSWLQRCPAERRVYEDGDDARRAALVDWYLKVVR